MLKSVNAIDFVVYFNVSLQYIINQTKNNFMKTVLDNINENKEILKGISKLSHYSPEQFIKDCEQYLNAIREKRMFCIIEKVSASGMSRNIKFYSCEKSKYDNTSWFSNYRCLFISFGFSAVKDADSFRIGGCGMDMIFHTNYTIIHRMHRLGLISKEDCDNLAQQTPAVL